MIVIVAVMVVVAAVVVVNKRRPTRHYKSWGGGGGDGGVTTNIKLNFKNKQINKRIIETQFKSVKTYRDNEFNNNNKRISRAPFHVKYAQLR